MNFGEALEYAKKGGKIMRSGWNGKNMYVWHVPAATVKREWIRDRGLLEAMGDDSDELDCHGFMRMKTADGKVVSGWLASQTDMLADDWEISGSLSEDNKLSLDTEEKIELRDQAVLELRDEGIICNIENIRERYLKLYKEKYGKEGE